MKRDKKLCEVQSTLLSTAKWKHAAADYAASCGAGIGDVLTLLWLGYTPYSSAAGCFVGLMLTAIVRRFLVQVPEAVVTGKTDPCHVWK